MNVELTIQAMFDDYPELFKERSDCLNQLFCVLGNGYEWNNGELVDDTQPFSKKEIAKLQAHLVNGKAFQHNKLSLRAEAKYYAAKRREQKLTTRHEHLPKEIIKKLDEEYFKSLPDDIYHKRPRQQRWYFHRPDTDKPDFCEQFVPLFNIPKNIQPDWKKALDECKTMLIEDGFTLPETKIFP